ncbi:MAG TPA: GNAT family N-acetyltransferase [Alphaproteobacteria bacterium]|nr:GNAT family N-acetyltransferase [Alphaproteobacteria bacterium]
MPEPVRIVWDNCTVGEWNALLARVPRSTLLQSWTYAQAMLLTERFRPSFGLIEHRDEPVGLVQVQVRRMFGLLERVHIDRGPLWLEPPPAAWQAAVLSALRRRFPARPGRAVHFLPEMPATPESAALLEGAGFGRAGPGYRTIWLDLRPEPEALRRRLDGKWRNRLVVAERAGLTVEADPAAKALPWLMELHEADMKARRYRGPSGPLVVRLRNGLWRDGHSLLLRALADGEPVAAALVLRHGAAATYQIGWSAPEGRRRQAQTLLLWQAALALRAAGAQWFDLGGINPEHAPGVTAFKRGLGGEEVETVGVYG